MEMDKITFKFNTWQSIILLMVTFCIGFIVGVIS